MDQMPKTEQKAAAEFDVVPPGPIHRNKRMMLAKFLQSTPAFASKPTAQWKLHPEKQKQPSKPRPQSPPPSTSTVPWVLEKDGDVVQRGVPDGPTMGTATPSQPATSHASSYFVFLKHGNTITAFPVDDVFNFKPLPRRPGAPQQTLESAELAMKGTRNMPGQSDLRLVPKSVKDAALRNAELKGVTAPGKGRGRGKGGKDDQSAILMASLFGEDEEEERPQKRGGGGRGRSSSNRAADGTELEAQEMPDDIYEGEQDDELRPAKPGKAEDWEHEEMRDDDDLGQGEDESEKFEDDPGERRKLGIEGGSEEEKEEEEDEEAKKRRLQQEEEGLEGQGVKYEGMEQDAVDTSSQGVTAAAGEGEDDLDLDAMAMDAFGAAPRVTSSSVKRKVEDEQAVPQIAGQPPRQGASKRARTQAPAPGQSTPAPRQQSPMPSAAAPGAPPPEVTTEEIARELQKAGGGLPLQQIRAIFAPRLKAKSATDAFKASLLQVARSDKGPDGKSALVVLKDEWRQKQQ